MWPRPFRQSLWKLSSLPASPSSPWIAPFFLRPPTGSSAAPGLWPGEGLGSPPAPAALEEAVGVGTSLASRSPPSRCTLNPTIPGCHFHFGSFSCLGVWRRRSFRSVCWLQQAWGTGRQVHARVGGWHGGAGGSGGARPRAAPFPPGAPALGVSWAVHPAPQVSGFLGSHVLRASSQMPLPWFAQAAHLTAALHSSRPPPSPPVACGHSIWAAVGRPAPLGL